MGCAQYVSERKRRRMRAVGVTGHVGGVDQPRDLEVVKRSRDAELAVGLLVVPEVAVIGREPYDTTGSWNMQHTRPNMQHTAPNMQPTTQSGGSLAAQPDSKNETSGGASGVRQGRLTEGRHCAERAQRG
jgi:hypothetical protein